jgi:peptidyl-prolyl cis-trans isomerase C
MESPTTSDITVNRQRIQRAEVAAEVQNHPVNGHHPDAAWQRAAEALVIRQLCLDAAAARGISADPQQLSETHLETPAEAKIRCLLEQVIQPAVICDSDVIAYYETHRENFRAPDLYEAAHIFIAAPKDDLTARAKASAKARDILPAVLINPAQLADIAAQISDCPSRTHGGRLGQIRPGDVAPSFQAALHRIAPGQVSPDIIETDFGVHIIRVDACAKGNILPLGAVRTQIVSTLEKTHWLRAAHEFVQQLIAQAEITGINMPAHPKGG